MKPRVGYFHFAMIMANWVGAIDYIYLIVSITSLIKIVLDLAHAGADTPNFVAYSVIALSIAAALRLTKTSIEIFAWDKPYGVRPSLIRIPIHNC
jgi:hypothetical protein